MTRSWTDLIKFLFYGIILQSKVVLVIFNSVMGSIKDKYFKCAHLVLMNACHKYLALVKTKWSHFGTKAILPDDMEFFLLCYIILNNM